MTEFVTNCKKRALLLLLTKTKFCTDNFAMTDLVLDLFREIKNIKHSMHIHQSHTASNCTTTEHTKNGH